MYTKLTLKIDKQIIERAKQYASAHDTSLSKLVENYLASITSEAGDAVKITQLVQSLSGVIQVDPDFDYKKDYKDHLIKKHQ